MAKTAGVLNIISGATHLLGAVFVLILGWLGDGVLNILWYGMVGTPLTPLAQPLSQDLQFIVAIPVLILGILAVLGGIYSIKGRSWGLALAGSISGALLTWFLGIPAIILTVISRKHFE